VKWEKLKFEICGGLPFRIVVNRCVLSAGAAGEVSWKRASKRVRTPFLLLASGCLRYFLRVGLLGNAAQNGWWIPSKAKYGNKTDSKHVPLGKDEKNFEKRVK